MEVCPEVGKTAAGTTNFDIGEGSRGSREGSEGGLEHGKRVAEPFREPEREYRGARQKKHGTFLSRGWEQAEAKTSKAAGARSVVPRADLSPIMISPRLFSAKVTRSTTIPLAMARLDDFLADTQRRELEDVRAAAELILRHPLDHTFTDHTVAHSERIRAHLNVLLGAWARKEIALQRERTQVEIFVLLAAVYLHDIGMQFQRFEHSPSLAEHLPTLRAELAQRGLQQGSLDDPFTRESLVFARRHHHLVTYDWVMKANLRSNQSLLPFETTGLRHHVEQVARVSWSHNVWLTNGQSYDGYRHLLVNAQEQEGEIRLGWLAAFLRLGDMLDMHQRRVTNIERLRSIEIPPVAKAHWWRHHLVRTWRLDDDATDRGRRLHVVFGVPGEHMADLEWLKPALHSATVTELSAEQDRLKEWLAPAGVWIELPSVDECQVVEDVSGGVFAMASETVEAFRHLWPGSPEGAVSQAQIQSAVEKGALTGQILGEQLRPLGVRAEIDDYLEQVGSHGEHDFRDTPYTPIEIDYGDFIDALDALQALLEKPDPHPHPRPIVVIGDPGGGKTTLVRRYVLDCARGLRTPQLLPIYAQLNRYGDREWAEAIECRLGTAHNPASQSQYDAAIAMLVQRLLVLLAERVCDLARLSYQHRDVMLRRLAEMMARKSCLIVLDGLNEVPPLQRGLAILAIRAFVEEYPAHRVLVTSRQGDYHEGYFSSAPHRVKPLREAALRAYWGRLGIRRATQERVLAPGSGGVAELATNPMYMYMLGELMKSGEPETIRDPGRLFQAFTRETLRRWHRGDASPLLEPEEMEQLLADVAFHALEDQAVSLDRRHLARGVDAWWARLHQERKRAIAGLASGEPVPQTGEPGQGHHEALLRKMATTGLLQQQGHSDALRYLFRHHTTQDYFAALAIARDVDVLPKIVGKAVFHEALRIVPAIVPDPNELVRRLTASTSHDLGRASLLSLCFSVAGAVQARLSPEVTRLLLAGVLPLFHAAVLLRVPYAAEVMGYLFSQVGWQALGRFLAEVAENPDLLPSTRDFAAQRLGRVLTRDDPAAAEDISALLGEAISPAIWADHRSARRVLEAEAGEESKLGAFPLAMAGLASSISLSVGEKLRIVHAFGRLTPNQLGGLQMLFIEETSAFGTLAIVDEKYNTEILGLYLHHRANLLLRRGDALFLQGEVAQAVAAYLEAWPSVATKQELLERLVHLSAEMTREQLARLADLLRAHQGEVCGWNSAVLLNDYSNAAWVMRREPRAHPSITTLLEELQAIANDPWLVLWLGAARKKQREVAPGIAGRLESIGAGIDWESSDGLLFLGLCSLLGGSEVRPQATALMERYYPERPSLRIERLKAALKDLPGERVAPEALGHLASLGFDKQFIDMIFATILEGFDIETARQFADDLGGYDQQLQFHARTLLATRLARAGDRATLEALMTSWGTTTAEFARRAMAIPLLRALFSMGDHSAVFDLLGWRRGRGLRSVLPAAQHGLINGNSDERLDLIASLLEEVDEPAEALAAALAGMDCAKAEGRDPQPFSHRTTRLMTKLGTPELEGDARALFAGRLLSLLGDPADTSWVLERLEVMRESGYLDIPAYARRLGEVLRSTYAHLGASRNSEMLKILGAIGHHEEVLRCLDAYVRACPRDPAQAADYLGNGAWYAYLAGDAGRFAEMTDSALALAPEGHKRDWLLGNRALGLVMAGQLDQALSAYAEARAAVADRARWQRVAVEDLEQHHIRRPKADPVSLDFIATVRTLGADLPEAPPKPGG